MIKVAGYDNLARDDSAAIVSCQRSDYELFMENYRAKMSTVERLNQLEERVKSNEEKLDLIIKLLKDNTNGNS